MKQKGKQKRMNIEDRYGGREEGSKKYGGNKERRIRGRKGCDSKSEEGRKSKKENGEEAKQSERKEEYKRVDENDAIRKKSKRNKRKDATRAECYARLISP